MRVGWGCDAHRFGGPGPTLLGGVEVDGARGVEATSDGDVLAHAVADALLNAADTVGHRGRRALALPHDALREVLAQPVT